MGDSSLIIYAESSPTTFAKASDYFPKIAFQN